MVAELLVAGPLTQEPLVRRRRQGVGQLLGQLVEHLDALLAQHLHCQLGQRRVDAVGRRRARVHEDQRRNPLRVVEHDVEHRHATHRVAEHDESVPAERVGQRQDVGREDLERVRRLVVRFVAVPVAPQVGRHRVPPEDGQVVEEIGEVLLGPAEPVDQQEGPAALPRLGDRQGHGAKVQGAKSHGQRLGRA